MRNHIVGKVSWVGLLAVVVLLCSWAAAHASFINTIVSVPNLSVNLSAPTIALSAAPTSVSAGMFGGAPLYFQVTSLDGTGAETSGSNVIATTTVASSTLNLSWTAVPGATTYRVYYATSSVATDMKQYFTATTSNQYNFTSTSSPTFVTGIPTTNSAYAIKIIANGSSWANGGNTGFGTSTPSAPVTAASASSPQFALSDNSGGALWTIRAIGPSFYIATSTASATSSTASLLIDGSGSSTKVVIPTSNTATSSLTVGCIQTYATSTATPIKLALTVSQSGTTTTSGTGIGFFAAVYGTCP